MRYLIVLLLLSSFVSSQVIRINIVDTLGHSDYAQIYQNDNMSIRYVQSVNISSNEPFDISNNHGFTIVLQKEDMSGVLISPNNPSFLGYWFYTLRYYLLYMFVIVVMLFMAYLMWKR